MLQHWWTRAHLGKPSAFVGTFYFPSKLMSMREVHSSYGSVRLGVAITASLFTSSQVLATLWTQPISHQGSEDFSMLSCCHYWSVNHPDDGIHMDTPTWHFLSMHKLLFRRGQRYHTSCSCLFWDLPCPCFEKSNHFSNVDQLTKPSPHSHMYPEILQGLLRYLNQHFFWLPGVQNLPHSFSSRSWLNHFCP